MNSCNLYKVLNYVCMQIETNFYYECSNLPLKYQYQVIVLNL